MLTTALFVGGAARSVKNTIAPKAETLGEAVLYADELASEDVQDQMLIGAIPAVFYGAAKAGFFMGLGYSAGYVAGQFLTK